VKNWWAPRAGCWDSCWTLDHHFPFEYYPSDPNWREGATLRKLFEERLNGSEVKEAVVSALLKLVQNGEVDCLLRQGYGGSSFPDALGDALNSWVTEVNGDLLNGEGYTCVLDKKEERTQPPQGNVIVYNHFFVRIVKGVFSQNTEIDGAVNDSLMIR
jgi:hypothetical protein